MPFSRPDPFLPETHRVLVVLRFLLNNPQKDGLFLAKFRYSLLFNYLNPFSRNR